MNPIARLSCGCDTHDTLPQPPLSNLKVYTCPVKTFEERLNEWLIGVEQRQLADLKFSEVSRALRALSATYVERRLRLGDAAPGAALSGAGKRAAFALFYAPLHALLVHHIARERADAGRRKTLIDLGCGTGAAGAAWACAMDAPPEIVGVDRHPWAVEEARDTYRQFGLRARMRMDDLTRAILPPGSHVLAAFAMNELPDANRARMLEKLLAHAGQGGAVTIVEPLAGFVAPWWNTWRTAVEAVGGRADEWRIRVALPPVVGKLDHAAGLNHREITGRSLTLRGSSSRS